MKIQLLKAFVAVSLFSSAVCGADLQLLGMLTPEAKLVAGINADQAKSSPFGQFLLSRIPEDDQGFRESILATGFDPRRDVREVLIASDGKPGRHNGVILVRGSFDAARIFAAAAKQQGHTRETYKGVEMLVKEGGALAFLSGTVAMAGGEDYVRAAIDRRNSPVSLEPLLYAKVNELSATQDVWVVSATPLSELSRRVPNGTAQGALNGDIVKKIERSSGGVKFGSIVQITGEALMETERDATALTDVIRFLASMAQLRAPASGPGANLVQSLDVRAEANTVKLSVGIAEDQLENLLKSQQRRASTNRRPAARKLSHPQ